MRRVLAALAAALCAASTLLAAPAATAAPAAEPAAGGFASCVAGGGAADVVLLIDDSSSLRSTDPGADRVTAAQYLVGQLQRFAERTGSSVDVQVAGFGDRYTRVGGWTPVSTRAAAVEGSVASFRTRTDGFDTDYWTALHRAQLDLAARAEQAGGRHCGAVVWFTDGRLDYSPRTTAAQRDRYGTRKVFDPDVELTSRAAADRVRRAAAADLCRAGGVADQLRSSGISVFAVGLGSDTGSPFTTMRAVATGSGACGRVAASGSFTRAADIDDLLFAFDAIGTPDAAPITQEAGICARTAGVCADGAHRFVLDASTPEVQVLAGASREGLEVRLLDADGTLVRIPTGGSGTRRADGARIAYDWATGSTVSLGITQAQASDADWSGVWQLAFVARDDAGGRSRTSIHIVSPIEPTVSGLGSAVRQGSPPSVRFGLAVRGRAVDPGSLLGDVTYRAVLVDRAGRSHPVLETTDPAEITAARRLPLTDVAVGGATLELEVRITTASATTADGERVAGTLLAPKQASVPLTVQPPAAYPAVAAAVDFGSVTGQGTAHATLATRGSGCIWIPDGAVRVQAGPADVRGFAVVPEGGATTRSSCARVGGTGRVALDMTSDGAGNGVLNGTVQVLTAPADGGDPVAATVAVTARYAKPLNTTNFLLTLVAALLLGPGIPLLLFFVMKVVVSRIPPRSLVAALIPVRVTGSGVTRDGGRFAVRADDFRRTVPIGPRGARQVDAAGFRLAVRLGASPFGLGRVVVEAPGRLVISDADELRFHEPAMLPLAVHDHFVLLRSPGAPEDSAEVLLLMAGDAGPVEQRDLADRVDRQGRAMLDVLLAAERGRGGAPADHLDGPQGGGGGDGITVPPRPDDQWSF